MSKCGRCCRRLLQPDSEHATQGLGRGRARRARRLRPAGGVPRLAVARSGRSRRRAGRSVCRGAHALAARRRAERARCVAAHRGQARAAATAPPPQDPAGAGGVRSRLRSSRRTTSAPSPGKRRGLRSPSCMRCWWHSRAASARASARQWLCARSARVTQRWRCSTRCPRRACLRISRTGWPARTCCAAPAAAPKPTRRCSAALA